MTAPRHDQPPEGWPDQPSVQFSAQLSVQLWNSLPADARTLLLRLRALTEAEARLALVGGAVRDLLLGQGQGFPDLDIVVQGGDVGRLAEQLGVPYTWHPAYGNAALSLPGGHPADLVSARQEHYPLPGGPPTPQPGTLEQDLARRDFSVNALALELRPGQTPALLGLPTSLDDLTARQLRPLHPHSFRDDASRLVRAARLAARLGLHAHPELLAQVPAALEMAPQTPRLAAELWLLLEEPLPGRAAQQLAGWGAASLLPPGSADLLTRLDALPGSKSRTLYAAALLSLPDPGERLARLPLGVRPAELLERARSGQIYPPSSLEGILRAVLGLTLPYPPLQGRDLLALGLPAGPAVGQMLLWLQSERQAGRFAGPDDERAAVLARLGAST